jgi:hypothetical protein
MNNFTFDSKLNDDLTDDINWVFDIDNLGGEMSHIPLMANDNDILKVTGDDSLQITISKEYSKQLPSAKKIMLMIFLAIRSIVCPKCGGVPKA